jgi:hypothetical protein
MKGKRSEGERMRVPRNSAPTSATFHVIIHFLTTISKISVKCIKFTENAYMIYASVKYIITRGAMKY